MLVALHTSPAAAQPFEQAGVRAQGFGGAFVAVADDATAVWWNPAGLAGGPFFNVLLEHQQQADPGSRVNAFALATPPLGLSYQRVRQPVPAAALPGTDRQRERGDLHAGTIVVHDTGLTLLHSVTAGFVVGSTVKFVRANVDGRGTSRLDFDLGAHYRTGSLRAGIVIRHVTEPSFGLPDGGEFSRERQVRAGLAWAGPATVVAADLDLTDINGPWPGRRLAVGAEQRIGQRFAARGGVRVRTSNGPDPWVSLGGSYAMAAGLWLDGFWGRSPDQDARWGIGARVAY
jgi:hypothetical protein